MVVIPVFDKIIIKSYKGEYSVIFKEDSLVSLNEKDLKEFRFIIDENVAHLYEKKMDKILSSGNALIITANEENKSLDKFPLYIEQLISKNIRRDHILVAVGGGIIQDITCFIAATLMRGLRWHFYPTTLLAQADSCIGSKSSINVGNIKNILGTFTPPDEVYISLDFLKTLTDAEIRSGIGEMLKVHAIDSPESFEKIALDYENLINDDSIMKKYIYNSLIIKKAIIELDEFDRGPRNIMNYGHTFGHAIESATDFNIPHGIAVSMGMDMANFVAYRLGLTEFNIYKNMHQVLEKNYAPYKNIHIDSDGFLWAISKDKKNIEDNIKFIAPNREGKISPFIHPFDELFKKTCIEYLNSQRLL
ncbi:MAG: iron-containing alcohol dehydrogenase [Syntrophorhabdaceae bacterium]|nr:iron-containing alcohol dehydrogenase [Syntrophorhabdaceae bacterium]